MGYPNRAPICRSPVIRLLLVEDNAVLAEATAEFIRSAGLDVRIAESGAAALQAALAFQPQIVLCDLRLPDMSGLKVARAVRRNPSTKDVLVALHTALDEDDVRSYESADEANAINLFLPKPITTERLEQLITALQSLRAA
jgi:CheY-like chemotaxis protein